MNWMSNTKPKIGERVLVTLWGGRVICGRWRGSDWFDDSENKIKVVSWARMPEFPPEGMWNRVEHSLPEEGERVLVIAKEGPWLGRVIAHLEEGLWRGDHGHYLRTVTHWVAFPT